MKELPKQFEGRGQVKGYVFNQISASQTGYLYALSSNGILSHYEVFKRSENTRFDCVSYPTDKAFGKWAWTTNDLERAKKILSEIEAKELLKINSNI